MNINHQQWLEVVISFFRNKRNIKLTIAGLCLYLFFLISTIPASIGLSWFNLPKNIKISELTGTLWSGKAKGIVYSGINLGSVKWDVQLLNMLLGDITADISIVKGKEYFKSNVSLSFFGNLELEETRFLIHLSTLQPLFYGNPFSYDGTISGYFPVSHFSKNNYIGLNGKLSLSSMKLVSPQRQSFGDFIADFRAENEGASSAKVKDNGGPLELSGQLKITKNGLLNIKSKLFSREKGASLEKMISFLGRKDGTGRIQLQHSMKLWK